MARMAKETKFGYGFWFAGIGVPYLLDQMFGRTPAFWCAVAFTVVGAWLLIAGHQHKEKGEIPLAWPQKLVGYVVMAVLLAGLGIGIVKFRPQAMARDEKTENGTGSVTPPPAGTASAANRPAPQPPPVPAPKIPLLITGYKLLSLEAGRGPTVEVSFKNMSDTTTIHDQTFSTIGVSACTQDFNELRGLADKTFNAAKEYAKQHGTPMVSEVPPLAAMGINVESKSATDEQIKNLMQTPATACVYFAGFFDYPFKGHQYETPFCGFSDQWHNIGSCMEHNEPVLVTKPKRIPTHPQQDNSVHIKTGKGGDAFGNGNGGAGGSINITAGNGGNAVGSITQGAGSIAQIGGSGNRAVINPRVIQSLLFVTKASCIPREGSTAPVGDSEQGFMTFHRASDDTDHTVLKTDTTSIELLPVSPLIHRVEREGVWSVTAKYSLSQSSEFIGQPVGLLEKIASYDTGMTANGFNSSEDAWCKVLSGVEFSLYVNGSQVFTSSMPVNLPLPDNKAPVLTGGKFDSDFYSKIKSLADTQ